MKRFGLVAALMVVLSGMLHGVPAYASANDFTVRKFEADYYLGRDAENRSTLKTVESITAEFPAFDQNHGIERAIPTTYNGHPTHLKIESVQDTAGHDITYSTYDGTNDNLVVRIGDADRYVHGDMTYVITYAQRDVTNYFADTNDDEFYWDVNGTQWQQSFGEVTARLHVDGALMPALNNHSACYFGAEQATDKCTVSRQGQTISVTVSALSPGQNVTIAIGFAPHTFASYAPSAFEKVMAAIVNVWLVLLVVSSAAGFILIFVIAFRYSSLSNRKKDIGTVIPEYLPPKEASVLISAQMIDSPRSSLAPQVIDLAVRHYVRLYQTKEKAFLTPAEYELEIVKSLDSLTQEERQFLEILFTGVGTDVGARLEMKVLRINYGIAAKLQSAARTLQKRIKGEYGLRAKDAAAAGWFKKVGIGALVISIVTVSPVLFIAGVVGLVCAAVLYPLTGKGLALRRYLMGLKLYIGVAEEERLKMLQSPEGSEKVGVTVKGKPKELIKLYERVLPYAILFGQEREWNKQLGVYYEQAGVNPDWYSGQAAFSAAMFASAMNDFGMTTNSYAASSSSSSGGSDGGGSSGGGGGGGGGGGW